MDDLGVAYKAFNESGLGKHFRGWLETQRKSTLEQAEKATSPEEAYGLTKTSYAYTVVLNHLNSSELINRK